MFDTDFFPTDPTGLPEAQSTETVDFEDGDRFEIRVAPVAKRIGSATVRMLAFNGSVPGPTLRVKQGSTLVVDAVNEGDLETTVHWHGLRLDNRFDGTPQTQAPIPVGGRFAYEITFPDPGVYWYHPHIREDYGQEMGLYGTIIVVPSDPHYWPPAHRELSVTLDDVLVEDGRIAPFRRSESNYTAMGRFGNVLLINGEPQLSLSSRRGEVLRLYLTNTANTRVFNVAVRGARMKLVGGDSGHFERESIVEGVPIAPSERAVVDILVEQDVILEHRTPGQTYTLGSVTVQDQPAPGSLKTEFEKERTNADMAAERERFAQFFPSEPDKTLALVARMDMGESEAGSAVTYVCPMHPEVISDEPGKCPVCGMKLLPAHLVKEEGEQHEHHMHHSHEFDGPEGIEWEDDMVAVNRITTPANTRWILIDRETGLEGAAIDWRFRVGDVVKIRLLNEMDSDHPMHHPFHIHGAGRFLILARGGVIEPNLVWKDTILVPTGQTADILLEVTNPGLWMAHCHIAEHHESGMMFCFNVDP